MQGIFTYIEFALPNLSKIYYCISEICKIKVKLISEFVISCSQRLLCSKKNDVKRLKKWMTYEDICSEIGFLRIGILDITIWFGRLGEQ